MSTVKTDQATAQDYRTIKREQHPSARPLQQPVKVAKFTITLAGALVAADIIKLGSLQTDGAVVIPERCVIVASSATTKFIAKLQSVLASASAVDESASATHDSGSAKFTSLARKTAGTNTVLDAASYLQVLVSTVSGFDGGTAADTLTFEIAYRCEKASG